ncbi:MAG: recombinase family protein, partial [Bdellovibrionales bacterium]|nr:recombinase family protein [Bdellovibrionales bacterium]NQZ20362.1 recombinase family protein [Bdellovibrionales bacterium]
MLRAVQNQEIDLVMVTELSRLSRSLKDFCEIFHMMKEFGCGFQSLREQYDTTTAAGEMILYTVANLAQFERRQTSERVSANFLARTQRGLYNGGPVPFGLKLNPEKKGYLLIDEPAAFIVKESFSTFVKEGSLSLAAKNLNNKGYKITRRREGGGNKTRLGHFTVTNLYRILKQRAYIGEKAYTLSDGKKKYVKACWPSIVKKETFDKVQKILESNHRTLKTRKSQKRYPFQLSKLTFCGTCNDKLSGKSANGNGGKIPYYAHGWVSVKQSCLKEKVFNCKNHKRFQAKLLEPAVWKNVESLLTNENVLKQLFERAQEQYKNDKPIQQVDRLKAKISDIDAKLEALVEHLAKVPKGISPEPIFAQMQKLEALKIEVKNELEIASEDHIQKPVELDDYRNFVKGVRNLKNRRNADDIKQKIIERLVHKIELLPEGYRLHYYVGADYFQGLKVVSSTKG